MSTVLERELARLGLDAHGEPPCRERWAALVAGLTGGMDEENAARERAEIALASAEDQLRQVQRMDAIGGLAGGIAHDFNNLLSIILSYTNLIHEDLGPADPRRADIEAVRDAANRAVDLIRQILAFERRQRLEPRVLDLGQVVSGVLPMLRRLVREDIEIAVSLARARTIVLADLSQIEQILVNLAVNARDAMPDGGTLTFETAHVTVQQGTDDGELAPGRYVRLTVRDTGAGMDEDTRRRAFEPFFTTKGAGRGTGLGLSTVFAIARQSGGRITVESAPGVGAAFHLLLPESDAVPEARSSLPPRTEGKPRAATILVVEDDDPVRNVTCAILRRQGYAVLDARNAGEAILVSEQHPAEIHLLLTDVVMPRMGGPELADRLSAARPSMRVVFMTGYVGEALASVRRRANALVLEKPITPDDLSRRIREALDRA
jgi:signal transduction histidine kinase